MPPLNEKAVLARLRAHGAAAHVIQGGSKGLLTAWQRFVAQVVHGYPFGLSDYRNDLDVRALIEVAGLSAQVATEDQLLRSILVPGRRDIWETHVTDAFWVQGYPRNASPELLADLQAQGLV